MIPPKTTRMSVVSVVQQAAIMSESGGFDQKADVVVATIIVKDLEAFGNGRIYTIDAERNAVIRNSAAAC